MKPPDNSILCGKISLSKEGAWFHEGVEITHERTIDLFNRSIEREGDRYVLRVGREVCDVDVEDAPYFVRQVDREGDDLMLVLTNGRIETLDPSTLEVGHSNVMYAKIGLGGDRAKFTRPAYYQLTGYLDEDGGGNYFLKVGKNNFPIK